MSVPITGTLTAYAGGPFPTHMDSLGKGGWKSYATKSARNSDVASFPLRHRQGEAASLVSDGSIWILTAGAPWAGDDTDWTVLPSGGSGSLEVDHAGTMVASRPILNFIDGTNVTLTVADNSGTGSVDVTIDASSGGSLPSGTAGQTLIMDDTTPAFSSILEVYSASSPNATGPGSFVQSGNWASGLNSGAVGKTNLASGEASWVEGQSNISSGLDGHSEGNFSFSLGFASHAENSSTASGDLCHAEGNITTSGPPIQSCTFSISDGHTVATISGVDVTNYFSPGSIAAIITGLFPAFTVVSGQIDTVVFSDGDTVVALTTNVTSELSGQIIETDIVQTAHSEGQSTTASANSAHSEGDTTAASAHAAHAEGLNTVASGEAAHAEGLYTHASGDGSHAEGAGTATGYGSHAEGNGTAHGAGAHAEGDGTAYGDTSHAEGEGQALGISSHAGGASIADLDYKWAHGDVQIWDTAGDAPDPHDGRSQSSLVQLSIKTTDATPTILLIKGGSGSGVGASSFRPAIAVNCACSFTANITARKTDGTALAMFLRQGMISNLAGTTTLEGSIHTIGTDINTPGWSVAITADDTNDALQIEVTGAADTTIRWSCGLDLVEVG